MNEKQKTAISKKLTYILRHNPESAGITLDKYGYTDVSLLLNAININFEQLDEVVATCNKKRFEFDLNRKKIRASQGHSVNVDLNYTPQEPPAILYHGTYEKVKDIILLDGLKKMNRHHVHLSSNIETARNVGGRRGRPVIFAVKANEMHLAGHKFYCSTNGVWLVEAVPPEYLDIYNG